MVVWTMLEAPGQQIDIMIDWFVRKQKIEVTPTPVMNLKKDYKGSER